MSHTLDSELYFRIVPLMLVVVMVDILAVTINFDSASALAMDLLCQWSVCILFFFIFLKSFCIEEYADTPHFQVGKHHTHP